MSIEDAFRTIVREVLAEAGLIENEETTSKSTKKKTTKKKSTKVKKDETTATEETPEEESSEVTSYEDMMGQIKEAIMKCKDKKKAQTASMDWLEENYMTRKFSDVEAKDMGDVVAGVVDVVKAL